jgi:hypothetical protein
MDNLNFTETIHELFAVASYKVEASDVPDAA